MLKGTDTLGGLLNLLEDLGNENDTMLLTGHKSFSLGRQHLVCFRGPSHFNKVGNRQKRKAHLLVL